MVFGRKQPSAGQMPPLPLRGVAVLCREEGSLPGGAGRAVGEV